MHKLGCITYWPLSIPRLFRARVNAAINRCTNPGHSRYRDYGGRGICVCVEWLEDRIKFAEYLMSLPGWDDESLVIDRINNDGNYVPGNLRFVSRSESNRNQRKRPPNVTWFKAGDKINRWTVLLDQTCGKGRIQCQCDCGTIKDVDVVSLRHRRSAGCLSCHLVEAREHTYGR